MPAAPTRIEVPDAGSRWITNNATVEQKALLLSRLYRGHLQRIRAAVARDYPQWDEPRRQVEIARRVSGGDPDVIEAARRRYGQAHGAE